MTALGANLDAEQVEVRKDVTEFDQTLIPVKDFWIHSNCNAVL